MNPEEPTPAPADRERFELETALRHAVESDGLSVYYQPLVRSGDGRILGVEALLRWNYAPIGAISPGRFVPLAEELGLMPQIGRWVLTVSSRQLAAWQQAGLTYDISLHVNLSYSELIDPGVLPAAKNAAENTGLLPAQLCFEVTEPNLIRAGEAGEKLLDALTAGGFRLVLDDFGLGSTIEVLTRYEFEFAKIDRALISNDDAARNRPRLLRGIGGLARSLGITLIAEGVEDEDELRRVAALGFASTQGYAVGRPTDPENFRRSLLGERNWGNPAD